MEFFTFELGILFGGSMLNGVVMLSRAIWKRAIAAVLLVAATAPAWSQSTLYAIGADTNGVGRVLTSPGSSSSTQLGDGSVAFNGGLAYSTVSNRLFAIENDSAGSSYLTSFSTQSPTTLSTAVALGSGFLGGLAFDTANGQLFAIGSNSQGNSSFYSVGATGASLLGSIGTGFYGGLTYDTADGSFYAIGAGTGFVQNQLSRIQLTAGGITVTTLFTLGNGSESFNGGIAFDAAQSRFAIIGSDSSGLSTLYAFTLAGAGTLAIQQVIGEGFINAGLAITPVPEPASALLALLGLCLVACRFRWQSPAIIQLDDSGCIS